MSSPAQAPGLEALCIEEVVDLHRFFEDWFNGLHPPQPQAMDRVVEALAEGFEIVSPNGRASGREVLIESLRRARGFRAKQGFRIHVDEARATALSDELCLVSYIERQEVGQTVTARQSTALLRRRDQRIEWLCVHETWIQAD